jgi:hypothetical protein
VSSGGPPKSSLHQAATLPMIGVHSPEKERREKIVALDAVVERVHQTIEGLASASPFEKRWMV